MNEYTELTRNMVISCENYLEKYQPLFTHRQIITALEYVINNVKMKWRVTKYNEIACEKLVDVILQDDAKPNLQEKVDELKKSTGVKERIQRASTLNSSKLKLRKQMSSEPASGLGEGDEIIGVASAIESVVNEEEEDEEKAVSEKELEGSEDKEDNQDGDMDK